MPAPRNNRGDAAMSAEKPRCRLAFLVKQSRDMYDFVGDEMTSQSKVPSSNTTIGIKEVGVTTKPVAVGPHLAESTSDAHFTSQVALHRGMPTSHRRMVDWVK